MLRRAVEKKPGMMEKLSRIYCAYKQHAAENELARWHRETWEEAEEWQPWPHPCSRIPPPVAAVAQPKGPVGLLIADAIALDLKMSHDFNLTAPKEQPIPILNVPFQYLAPMVSQLAARARTVAAYATKKINRSLQEIDKEATCAKGE